MVQTFRNHNSLGLAVIPRGLLTDQRRVSLDLFQPELADLVFDRDRDVDGI